MMPMPCIIAALIFLWFGIHAFRITEARNPEGAREETTGSRSI
jgi:hypothetical protein